MPTIKEQIDEIVENFGTNWYDPKLDCLVKYLDHPELFEHMFSEPLPSKDERMRRVMAAILS